MFPRVAFISGSAVVAAVSGAGISSFINKGPTPLPNTSVELVEQPVPPVVSEPTPPVLAASQQISEESGYDSEFEGYWSGLSNKKDSDKKELYRRYVNHRVNAISEQITTYGISQFDALYKQLIDEQTRLLTSAASVLQ